METSAYYYGDGTDNVVQLTEQQANAANNFRFTATRVDSENNEMYGTTNLTQEEMVHYSAAAKVLNEYLADHEVYQVDTDSPILRPVK